MDTNGKDWKGASVTMDGRVCHEDGGVMVEFDRLVASEN